jgi:hypothetical protein
MNEGSPLEERDQASTSSGESREARLHALIERFRGKRTWPLEEAKAAGDLAASLLNTSSTEAQIDSLFSLTSELPLSIVESVFEKEWPTIDPERRQMLLGQLLKQTSDKMQTRQAAIAEKIAPQDRRSAASILEGLILSGRRGTDHEFWPHLTKEKKELLRSRFGHRSWVYFNEPNENLMSVLLAGFTEAMSDSGSLKSQKSHRPVFDFARWALSIMQRVPLADADRNLVTKKISEISEEFPYEWKDELARLAGPLMDASTRVESQITAPPTREKLQDLTPTPPDRAGTEVTTPPLSVTPKLAVTSDPKADPNATLQSALSSLIERRQREQQDLFALVEVLQNNRTSIKDDVELLRRILKELEKNKAERKRLQSDLEETILRSEGLQTAISRLQSQLDNVQKHLMSTQDDCQLLGEQKQALQVVLDQEKRGRATERSELEEEIQRTASANLAGFKAQLARSLRPILLNKRTTDDQEPSARLAEFLRSWVSQIEGELKTMGIDIAKD